MNIAALISKYARLCRIPIALFTAYSALSGFLLAPGKSLSTGITTVLAVFTLAAGASALNQWQERHIDARMERTRRRPLPAGSVSPGQALSFALVLIIVGLGLLFLTSGTAPFVMGIAAVLWYNGIYTRLKHSTAFAAVPGAIVGMIAPAIGWLSAKGDIADPRLLALCFLFFMWQVPHFWIQVLDHGQEYEDAGLPSLTSVLTKEQIGRMTFAWICSAAVSGLLLPLYGAIKSPLLCFLLLPVAARLVVSGFKLMTRERTPALTASVFRMINAYIILVMSLLSIESLFVRMP